MKGSAMKLLHAITLAVIVCIVFFHSVLFPAYPQNVGISDDPGNLTKFRNQNEKVLSFRVRGATDGNVWGGADGIYTDDSRLAKAAVHAGLLKPGEEGVVSVIMLPGRTSYTGSTQNGVTTTNYGGYSGSFRFVADAMKTKSGGEAAEHSAPGISILNDPGNVTAYRSQNINIFSFRVRGTTDGNVWGGSDGFYTDDSRLGKAAVHAGILKPGEEGVVSVIILPGRSSYAGGAQNGVTTANYGSYSGSFRFTATTPDDPGNLVKFLNDKNKILTFRVRGASDGNVWGGADGFYTHDSRLAKAAVHAGLLKPGDDGILSVIILPGRASYTGSAQNGVTTADYGSYSGSFRFADLTPADPGNLVKYRGQNNITITFRVRGTSEGTVWGGADGIYTDDSRLGKAAVHAGLLKPGEEGVVTVIILPGRTAYTGSAQNGVATNNYGNFSGSFRFD